MVIMPATDLVVKGRSNFKPILKQYAADTLRPDKGKHIGYSFQEERLTSSVEELLL